MSNGWAKVTAKTAAEVCKHFPLGEEAKKLLRDGQTPAQFLDVLIEKQQFPDAVRFLAHALPKREAVWWACLCSRAVAGSRAVQTFTTPGHTFMWDRRPPRTCSPVC